MAPSLAEEFALSVKTSSHAKRGSDGLTISNPHLRRGFTSMRSVRQKPNPLVTAVPKSAHVQVSGPWVRGEGQ